MDEQLQSLGRLFVWRGRARGDSDEAIARRLLAMGWSRASVQELSRMLDTPLATRLAEDEPPPAAPPTDQATHAPAAPTPPARTAVADSRSEPAHAPAVRGRAVVGVVLVSLAHLALLVYIAFHVSYYPVSATDDYAAQGSAIIFFLGIPMVIGSPARAAWLPYRRPDAAIRWDARLFCSRSWACPS